jgi:hypothetical protein
MKAGDLVCRRAEVRLIVPQHRNRAALDEPFTDAQRDFRDLVYECKRLALRASMSGEQNNIARRLDRIKLLY